MRYIFLDLETTGLDHINEQIIEIGAIKTNENLKVIDSFNMLVALDEGRELSDFIVELTGIDRSDLAGKRSQTKALSHLKDFIGKATIVAQNAPFDLSFISHHGDINPEQFICTRNMSRMLEPELSASLKDIVERHGIDQKQAHRAMNDAHMLLDVFKIFKEKAEKIKMAYKNMVMDEPDRPLKFTPKHATVRKAVKIYMDADELEAIVNSFHTDNAFGNNINGVLKRLRGI